LRAKLTLASSSIVCSIICQNNEKLIDRIINPSASGKKYKSSKSLWATELMATQSRPGSEN
jgi:hypothetical protein